MGIGGISIWQLLIILLIVVLLFGTKKLRNMGGDIGSAIKNFRKSVKDPDADDADADSKPGDKAQDATQKRTPDGLPGAGSEQGRVIDAEVEVSKTTEPGQSSGR